MTVRLLVRLDRDAPTPYGKDLSPLMFLRRRFPRIPGRNFWQSWILWNFAYSRVRSYALAGDKRALEALIRDGGDPESHVYSERAVAEYALGMIGDQSDTAILAPLVRPDTRVDVRICASHALAQIGGPEAARVLRAALRDETYAVKRDAIRTIARFGSREDIPVLSELAQKDPEQLIRGEAAHAIGRLGTPDSIPVLTRIAITDTSTAALGAVSGIVEIGGGDACQALHEVARAAQAASVRFSARRKGRLGCSKH